MFVRTKVFKFEIVATFRVPTLAVGAEMLERAARVWRFEIVATFRVPTLAKGTEIEFKFEIVETFRVPTLAVGVVRFETDTGPGKVVVPSDPNTTWYDPLMSRSVSVPVPGGPCGPCGPWGPAGPVGPWGPGGPPGRPRGPGTYRIR